MLIIIDYQHFNIRSREVKELLACAKARGVHIDVFWFESVESPNECQFEIAGHIADFHPIVLTGMIDGHFRRPPIEYIIGFQIQLTASFLSKLPFNPGIDFPNTGKIGYSLQ